MNGKKARALRRQAEGMTVGQQAKWYVRQTRSGTVALIPRCTRAVYQRLKRQA